jgi:hypothetical protein
VGAATSSWVMYVVELMPAGGSPPVGTVLWSNPGNGSGFSSIVPAVPSATGVADVFGFQNDGTVQAITSSGVTAWSANVQNASAVPDFQGGLVVSRGDGNNGANIFKLDGITGQAYPAYNVSPSGNGGSIGVHTDGTVFAMTSSCTLSQCTESVIGIDPIAGTQKFSVPFMIPRSTPYLVQGGIIAGDGYYYVAFITVDTFGVPPNYMETNHLTLLRVNSTGAYDVLNRFLAYTNAAEAAESWIGAVTMITNADTGIFLALATNDGNPSYFVTTTGTSFSAVRGQQVPGLNYGVVPVLQAQDGSFVGSYYDLSTSQTNMAGFDGTGNVRWVISNQQPQIATADGGVITQSGTTFDQNGNATGLIANLPTYSWLGNAYQIGSALSQVQVNPLLYAVGFWEFEQANQSRIKTAPLPTDSKADSKVKGILTKTFWSKFSSSNCAAVVGNSNGLPLAMLGNSGSPLTYSLAGVINEQNLVNFYDISNGGVGNLTREQISTVQSPQTLTAYLGLGNAFTLIGQQKVKGQGPPIILAGGVLAGPNPEFVLVHEVLFHAYAALGDDAIFGNAYFTAQGLWRPANSGATTNISTWLSTDCKCTPGNPAAQSCQANTAKW